MNKTYTHLNTKKKNPVIYAEYMMMGTGMRGQDFDKPSMIFTLLTLNFLGLISPLPYMLLLALLSSLAFAFLSFPSMSASSFSSSTAGSRVVSLSFGFEHNLCSNDILFLWGFALLSSSSWIVCSQEGLFVSWGEGGFQTLKDSSGLAYTSTRIGLSYGVVALVAFTGAI